MPLRVGYQFKLLILNVSKIRLMSILFFSLDREEETHRAEAFSFWVSDFLHLQTLAV